MTNEEAEKVSYILCEADGGSCHSCAFDLLEKFKKEFPKNVEIIEKVYNKKFPEGW